MLDPVSLAKKAAAFRAVADHFSPRSRLVGIGSGTTVAFVVDAIRDAVHAHLAANPGAASPGFLPSSDASERLIRNAGLPVVPLDSARAAAAGAGEEAADPVALALPVDVTFDGADEVDAELNCIKGGGACLFREKLLIEMSRRFVCVADYRKERPRLLSTWEYIPIEVAPAARESVTARLATELNCGSVVVRSAVPVAPGAGAAAASAAAAPTPLLTDQGFFILDAFAPGPLRVNAEEGVAGVAGVDGSTPSPAELLARIGAITGVLEVGIFTGLDGDEAAELILKGDRRAGMPARQPQRPVAVYLGMADGSVVRWTRSERETVVPAPLAA